MWHSDTISLALSRCCLHTHAPARLHVHTDTQAHSHTHTMFSLCFSRCSAACICVTDTVYVCVFTSHLSKNVFQLCNGRCNMRTYDLPSRSTNTLCLSSKRTHTQKSEPYWQTAWPTACFYICRGFHNNNIKAIPERAFVGNPQLQTMWAWHWMQHWACVALDKHIIAVSCRHHIQHNLFPKINSIE